MICNGSSVVNAVRSELSAGVCMSETASVQETIVRGSEEPAKELAPSRAVAGDQTAIPHDVMVSVFVHTTNGKDIAGMAEAGVHDQVKRGTLQTATLPLDKVEEIAKAKTSPISSSANRCPLRRRTSHWRPSERRAKS
jgi:hypothetical protein